VIGPTFPGKIMANRVSVGLVKTRVPTYPSLPVPFPVLALKDPLFGESSPEQSGMVGHPETFSSPASWTSTLPSRPYLKSAVQKRLEGGGVRNWARRKERKKHLG
jgi:hypothetical protein